MGDALVVKSDGKVESSGWQLKLRSRSTYLFDRDGNAMERLSDPSFRA